ncbi:UvrD-helicase domain-containing protein [Halobacillus sp. SY10]|uniref:UvrD-helicase domain-containing protein n=1 Tax=Halobacillus sp. SY10 TaxID=3381356 RepID=UPI00387A58C3
MGSTFNSDIDVEKEVSKFIDSYMYSLLGYRYERMYDKDSQKKGIDVYMRKQEEEVFIDDKCAIYFANKDLKTFTFELSYMRGPVMKQGWFLDHNQVTTHYNVMWMKTRDGVEDTRSIKFNDITEIEAMIISKRELQKCLETMGYTTDDLIEFDSLFRNSGLRSREMSSGVDMIISRQLPEKPVNIKIEKEILSLIADDHYIVTPYTLRDLKKKKYISKPDIPECAYSYVLQAPTSEIDKKKEVIRYLMEEGVKVLIFTDGPITSIGDSYIESKMLQVFINEQITLNRLSEVFDGDRVDEVHRISSDYPGFNFEQFKIEHAAAEENMIVQAGAGTGKTTVMIDRLQYLMLKEKVNPVDIVMITFTRDAAKHMYDKLKEALLKKYKCTHNPRFLHIIEGLNDMRIQTIPSFGKDLLKELGQLSGLGLNFKLRSFKSDKKKWLEEALDDLLDGRGVGDDLNALFKPLQFHEFIDCAYDFWEKFEQKGFTTDEIASAEFGESSNYSEMNELVEKMIKNTLERYIQVKDKTNSLSLNDLTRHIDEIHKKDGSSIFGHLQKPVDYLFVDEFQDSDDSQIRLFSAIQEAFQSKMFVVGDTKQSIYRFRGANHTAFKVLSKQLANRGILINDKDYRLFKNYRSTTQLLEEMERFFSFWKQKGWLDDSMERLQGMNDGDVDTEHLTITKTNKKDKKQLRQEAMQLIMQRFRKVKQLNKEKNEGHKVAVLTRTIAEARLVDRWCREENLFTDLKVGGDFFTSPSVREFHSLLLFLLHPDEPKFAFPVINGPYGRGRIRASSLVHPGGFHRDLKSSLRNHSRKLYEYVDELKFKPVLSVLRTILSESELYDFVFSRERKRLEKDGYSDEYSEEQIKEMARLHTLRYKRNLGKLFEKIHQVFSEEFVTLNQIQSWLEINIATNRDEDQVFVEDGDSSLLDRINILTAHRAKGLEFHTVVIPFTDRIFENVFNEILFGKNESSDRVKVGWRIKKINEGEKYNDNHGFMSKGENEEMKMEESRLLYVAMTRAERELCIIRNWKNDRHHYTWSRILDIYNRG